MLNGIRVSLLGHDPYLAFQTITSWAWNNAWPFNILEPQGTGLPRLLLSFIDASS